MWPCACSWLCSKRTATEMWTCDDDGDDDDDKSRLVYQMCTVTRTSNAVLQI